MIDLAAILGMIGIGIGFYVAWHFAGKEKELYSNTFERVMLSLLFILTGCMTLLAISSICSLVFLALSKLILAFGIKILYILVIPATFGICKYVPKFSIKVERK